LNRFDNTASQFHRDILINLIAGIVTTGVLAFGLVGALATASGGASGGLCKCIRGVVVSLGVFGLIAVAGACAHYAIRHRWGVHECKYAATANLPWCKRFFGHDDWGNRGEPGLAWYLLIAASACSLAACIASFFVKPRKHYLSLR
jgi:hypothetical protein